MIPWIIVAVVVVPLVVVAFAVARRNTAAGERLEVGSDAERARSDREFAEAESYEAEWHKTDKERFHDERLP